MAQSLREPLPTAFDQLASAHKPFRFVQISTDAVYGSRGLEGVFRETTPCAPNSPYSVSRAAADHVARAYCHTFGLPVIVTVTVHAPVTFSG